MTAPRIDSVRREINDAIDLLRFIADQLEDVHALAYNRHRAAQEAKVRGGDHDYALDTHGDPTARRLYSQAAEDLRHLVQRGTRVAIDLRSYLTEGKPAGAPRDRSADSTVDEVLAALDARRRRRTRNEYTPSLIADQPTVLSQTDWQTECEALRSAVAKVTTMFAADHQHCRIEGRKPLRRYPMNQLTPRERDAWRRSVRKDEDEKAS